MLALLANRPKNLDYLGLTVRGEPPKGMLEELLDEIRNQPTMPIEFDRILLPKPQVKNQMTYPQRYQPKYTPPPRIVRRMNMR